MNIGVGVQHQNWPRPEYIFTTHRLHLSKDAHRLQQEGESMFIYVHNRVCKAPTS